MDVSIIVPAYNEAHRIDYTLERLHSVVRKVRLSYEVVVIDNGSTDSTAERALYFADVLRLDRRETISTARNRGAALAKGRVLAFVDADVWLTDKWAEHLHSQLSNIVDQRAITGGQYLVSVQPSWVERYWFKALEERRPSYINAGNLILSAALFEELEGFDRKLATNEDVDLCRRATSRGVNVEPDAGFAAHHDGYPRTLSNFFKRELWCGRGDFSSIKAFLASKTAMFAALVTLVVVSSVVCSLFGQWRYSAFLLFFVLAAAVAASLFKYGLKSLRWNVVNSALMVVYLIGRGLAFVRFEKKA